MESKSKMARFLLNTVVCASMLCACTNDVIKSDVDGVVSMQRHRLPQVRPDYGELHNILLDACLAVCQGVDTSFYVVEDAEDGGFYDLYAEYSAQISYVLCEYLSTNGGDVTIIPSVNGGNAITTPQEFWSYQEIQRGYIMQNFIAGDSALHSVERLLDTYAELINEEAILYEDPYWQELAENIDDYAETIYSDCESLCITDEERESLEIMLSVMAGSFDYWSNPEKMAAWRDMEWNAKCKYLNVNELPDLELERLRAENKKTTGEKLVEFILADATGAGATSISGPCSLALAGFCSAAIALTWD